MNLGNYETARIGVTITVPCSKETLGRSVRVRHGMGVQQDRGSR